MKKILLIVPLLLCACSKESRAHERNQEVPPARQPDTGLPREGTMAPVEQGNNTADLSLTERVRQALQSDNSLSTEAKNVKVVTRSGIVTLSGTVKTDAEKTAVAAKAGSVAGATNVVNQITVQPH